MKIEFVKNDPEKVSLSTLKPGDWFLYGEYSVDNTPRVYCLLDAPCLADSAPCFNSSKSSIIRIFMDRKVIPVETTLQVTKKPVRPVGTGCF